MYLVPVTEGFLKSDELGDGSATPHQYSVDTEGRHHRQTNLSSFT